MAVKWEIVDAEGAISEENSVRSDDTFLAEAQGRNAWLFCVVMALGYFSAPVVYVGMIHAALCAQLGANATVSNLPAALSSVGMLAPFIACWLVPYRLERATAVAIAAITAALMAAMAVSLVLVTSPPLLIFATVAVALFTGILSNVQMVYLFQCLNRGTTGQGRARALKITYTVGPLCAVAGSLTAQGVLGGVLGGIQFPLNFAVLFTIGVPTALGAALATSQMKLIPIADRDRSSFRDYLSESFSGLRHSRSMILLAIAYILCTCGINVFPNLTLYGKDAMAIRPELVVGMMLTFRFGFKSLSGFCFGLVTQAWGNRVTLVLIQFGMMAAVTWAAFVRGPWYLLAFAFMGASELAGAYFPNYCMTLSSTADGARNMAILTLASALAGFASPAHGGLADQFGFRASFAFTLLCGLLATWLILKIPQASPDLAPAPAQPSEVFADFGEV